MRMQITTDGMQEPERFDAWHAAVFSALAISVQPLPGVRGPFRARFFARSSGPLLNCGFDSDGFLASRKSREIATRQWHGYRIYCESSPGVRFRIAGEEIISATGDLLFADADAPFEALPVAHYRDESWLLPKALVDPYLPTRMRGRGTRLSGHAGVAALAASYLDALSRNWESIPEAAMGAAADTLARLVGIACGAAAGEQGEAVRKGRLAAATRYIDDHVTDPHLSPSRVAAALGLSVRGLHLLFEPTGTSFARHLLRRRLEACRAALLADPTRPVTDVAFAWGFVTLSSFYRAFRAAFGTSPGELRVSHRDLHSADRLRGMGSDFARSGKPATRESA